MANDDAASTPPARAPWGSLAIMYLLTIMSLIDRLILALLVTPLKADLGLSNLQLGLLFGTAFAVFYALMGLPIAQIADRFHRVRLVTVAVVLWSLCTIASGFASSFWQLLVLRAGLALGEAALFPTVHSLIHDLFDAKRRPLAASIVMTAPPLGGALAFAVGGWLVGALGRWVANGGGGGFAAWQLVFLAVGVPSLLLGLLFGLTVAEPPRRARESTRATAGLRSLAGRRRMFVLLLIAGGLCQVLPYSYQAWAPSLLTGKYGFSIAQAGGVLGVLGALGAVLGSLLVPILTLRLFDRGQVRALALVPLAAVAVATAVLSLAPLQDAAWPLLAAYCLGNFCLLGANAAVMVAMQRLAPDGLRATMIAGTLLVSSSFGLGIGPVLVAWLADAGGGAPRFDRALATVAVLAGALALLAFALSARRIAVLRRSGAFDPIPDGTGS